MKNEQIDLAFLNFYGFWSTKEERKFTKEYIAPKRITLIHIPPAETKIVKDSVKGIYDFIDITVFESSMKKETFFMSHPNNGQQLNKGISQIKMQRLRDWSLFRLVKQ